MLCVPCHVSPPSPEPQTRGPFILRRSGTVFRVPGVRRAPLIRSLLPYWPLTLGLHQARCCVFRRVSVVQVAVFRGPLDAVRRPACLGFWLRIRASRPTGIKPCGTLSPAAKVGCGRSGDQGRGPKPYGTGRLLNASTSGAELPPTERQSDERIIAPGVSVHSHHGPLPHTHPSADATRSL